MSNITQMFADAEARGTFPPHSNPGQGEEVRATKREAAQLARDDERARDLDNALADAQAQLQAGAKVRPGTVAALKTFVRIDPTHAQANLVLGYLLMKGGDSPAVTAPLLRQAIKATAPDFILVVGDDGSDEPAFAALTEWVHEHSAAAPSATRLGSGAPASRTRTTTMPMPTSWRSRSEAASWCSRASR